MGSYERERGFGGLEGERKDTIADDEHPLFFVDSYGSSNEDTGRDSDAGFPVYDRYDAFVLGDAEQYDQQGLRNRCFNCGSPDHTVSKCKEQINRPLVALSRAMFEFFRNSQGGEAERLHEYEERKAARLQFLQSFSPGVVEGELLLEALGLIADDECQGNKFPWLWIMLEWGYPPGWFSETNPKSMVMVRIEGEDTWMDEGDASQVFDDPFQVDTAEVFHVKSPDVPGDTDTYSIATLSDIEKPQSRKRWAYYETDLFSSEHLTVYSGKRLPPLTASDDIADQRKNVPPWRRPDAFSAFGPAGWRELVKHQDSQFHNKVEGLFEKDGHNIKAEANDSDMEFSD